MSRKTKRKIDAGRNGAHPYAGGDARGSAEPSSASVDESFERGFHVSDSAWMWASLAVLVVAACVRLYALELKPLHHDEGVNGFFLTNLVRTGTYRYDPSNYHGTTLFYLTLPIVLLTGLETWALRLVPVLFGVGTVALLLKFDRRTGRLGALVAAMFVAVSPGAIYFSRYYIHETPFVFFTIAAVWAWLRFAEDARVVYLCVVAVALAMMFATKETAFISLGVLLIAAAMTRIYAGRNGVSSDIDRFGGANKVVALVAVGAGLFVIVNALFYSSFFTNAAGLSDAFEAFAVWRRTGTSDFHAKPFETYLRWLAKEETALLILGALGGVWAIVRRRNAFAVFAALWAGGIVMAYSLVKYKTPWLLLNFVPPLALCGGYFVESLAGIAPRNGGAGARRYYAPLAAGLLLVALLAVSVYRGYVLNFVRYDDDAFSYVYAHSTRDLTGLDADVRRVGARPGAAEKLTISIHAPDYWPLPWYFRDDRVVAYPPQPVGNPTAAVLVLSEAQANAERARLADAYDELGRYRLRPGVDLVLFARR